MSLPELEALSGKGDILHPRIARQRLAFARDMQAHLSFARRALVQLDRDVAGVDNLLAEAAGLIEKYTALAEGRIEGRRRPPQQRSWTRSDPPRRQFYLCLDECGSHKMHPQGDKFTAFGLSGIFIDAEMYPSLDRRWKTWKANRLGSPEVIVHEPDVRKRNAPFYREDVDEQHELYASLEAELKALEYGLISAVINKTDFHSEYGSGSVDEFLPASQYLMSLDFIIERFVHFLYYVAGDARGIVLAESRGTLEDAQVQQEYVRLMIEGTQYHSASWFRYQLAPFIEFLPKHANHSGLQLADLAARPCAEKVIDPASTPHRWETFRAKLYDGNCGRPESYGLKAFPAGCGLGIFPLKADEDASAPPSTD